MILLQSLNESLFVDNREKKQRSLLFTMLPMYQEGIKQLNGLIKIGILLKSKDETQLLLTNGILLKTLKLSTLFC